MLSAERGDNLWFLLDNFLKNYESIHRNGDRDFQVGIFIVTG